MSNLLSFKTGFQKVDKHTEDKWLVNSTQHRKDNQLPSLELPCKGQRHNHPQRWAVTGTYTN